MNSSSNPCRSPAPAQVPADEEAGLYYPGYADGLLLVLVLRLRLLLLMLALLLLLSLYLLPRWHNAAEQVSAATTPTARTARSTRA